MTDHGIGGVDRLVEDDARQAEQSKPESRGDNAIRGILAKAFEGSARNARAVEPIRVTPDDAAHRDAALLDRYIKTIRHRQNMIAERFLGEERDGDDSLGNPAIGELAKEQGIFEKTIFLFGGPRVVHKTALELGFDAGFGPGTRPSDVANFIYYRLMERSGRPPSPQKTAHGTPDATVPATGEKLGDTL